MNSLHWTLVKQNDSTLLGGGMVQQPVNKDKVVIVKNFIYEFGSSEISPDVEMTIAEPSNLKPRPTGAIRAGSNLKPLISTHTIIPSYIGRGFPFSIAQNFYQLRSANAASRIEAVTHRV